MSQGFPLSKLPKAKAESRLNDADETKRNILDVATREFSEKGLAGARIDEIAEKTNSSKRMIYYYFGGKDELYRAVLEKAYSGIREREAEADFDGLSADTAMRAHIETTFDYHTTHPEFNRLVLNENIHHAEHLRHVDGIKDRSKLVIAALQTIIDKGVKEGVFRDDIDPVDLHMTISALCFFNLSNRYTFSHIFNRDIGGAQALTKRRIQVVDIVMGWVAK
jgi:AcrR family transcriptional regulator